MSKFLEQVNQRRVESVALAHRIALLIDKTSKKALLVEAGDDMFIYTSFLRQLGLHTKTEIFPAEGRSKVLKVVQNLISMGKKDWIAGIIDRDFHFNDPTLILDGKCYVLEYYSFENLFLERQTLTQFGQTFLAIDPDSNFRDSWLDQVSNFIESLPKAMKEEHVISAACVAENKICNLKNVDVMQLTISSDNGAVLPNLDMGSEFLRLAQISVGELSDEAVMASRMEVDKRSVQQFFRGHFFWPLFVRMLNMFRLKLDAFNAAERRNRTRTRAVIGERHALEAAVPFAALPGDLADFLRKNLG